MLIREGFHSVLILRKAKARTLEINVSKTAEAKIFACEWSMTHIIDNELLTMTHTSEIIVLKALYLQTAEAKFFA